MSIVNVEVSLPSEAFALGQILHDHGDLRIDLRSPVTDPREFHAYSRKSRQVSSENGPPAAVFLATVASRSV